MARRKVGDRFGSHTHGVPPGGHVPGAQTRRALPHASGQQVAAQVAQVVGEVLELEQADAAVAVVVMPCVEARRVVAWLSCVARRATVRPARWAGVGAVGGGGAGAGGGRGSRWPPVDDADECTEDRDQGGEQGEVQQRRLVGVLPRAPRRAVESLEAQVVAVRPVQGQSARGVQQGARGVLVACRLPVDLLLAHPLPAATRTPREGEVVREARS